MKEKSLKTLLIPVMCLIAVGLLGNLIIKTISPSASEASKSALKQGLSLNIGESSSESNRLESELLAEEEVVSGALENAIAEAEINAVHVAPSSNSVGNALSAKSATSSSSTQLSGSSSVVDNSIQLGLSMSEEGKILTTYLKSDPICSGDGISQGTVTIRWPKNGTALLSDTVTPALPGMNVSCINGGDGIPESQSHDFMFCSIEPDPNTNIAINFQTGQEIPFFTVNVAGVGYWQLEDLSGVTVLPGIDATKPYLNIQNIDCASAVSDQRNYILIDEKDGTAANILAYDVQEITNEGSLPVELTSFDVTAEERDVLLTWETSTEQDNAGFSVEMASLNGGYEEIAYVQGNGTTSEVSSYSYTMKDAEFGVFKFRLKQIDFDGKSSYSPEVDLTLELPDDIIMDPAYPNPFNPATTVRFAVKERQDVTLQLFDLQGRLVKSLYQGQMDAGVMRSFRVDGSDLSSGTYLVQLRGLELKRSVSQTILLVK